MIYLSSSRRLVVLLGGTLLSTMAPASLLSPSESQRYGYGLPVVTTTGIWGGYPAAFIWRGHRSTLGLKDHVVDHNVEYVVRDSFKNLDKAEAPGVTARSAATKVQLWHAAFPLEPTAGTTQAARQIESSTLILRGNRLFCSYLVTPNSMTPKVRFWEFMILDTETGKIVRRERSKVAEPQINFTIVGGNWFVTDELSKQTMRLEPATGEPMWTYPRVLNFSSVTDASVSFFRRPETDTWEVESLDIATGKTIFTYRFTGLQKHIIKAVLARDGRVFVEFGAQYDWNLHNGPMYKTYSVAFDVVTRTPIWRTPFFD